jgi:hypothetical protein
MSEHNSAKTPNEHITELYDRVYRLTERCGFLESKILENKISDLQSNEGLKKEIREFAQAAGKKAGSGSGKLWAGVSSVAVLIIRELISHIF